jgi:hypothetical protein
LITTSVKIAYYYKNREEEQGKERQTDEETDRKGTEKVRKGDRN